MRPSVEIAIAFHLRLATRWRSSPAGAGARILAGLHRACAVRILDVRDDVVNGEGEDERKHVQDNDELVLDATAQRSLDPRLPLLSFESSVCIIALNQVISTQI